MITTAVAAPPAQEASAGTRELAITGMTCASCVRSVETALAHVPGVASAEVNLANERATVRLAAAVEPGALVHAVERAGYGALVIPEGDAARSAAVDDERALRLRYVASLQRRLVVASVFGALTILLSMVAPLLWPDLMRAPWRP
jgi:Cu+-exporting ATPase